MRKVRIKKFLSSDTKGRQFFFFEMNSVLKGIIQLVRKRPKYCTSDIAILHFISTIAQCKVLPMIYPRHEET